MRLPLCILAKVTPAVLYVLAKEVRSKLLLTLSPWRRCPQIHLLLTYLPRQAFSLAPSFESRPV